MTSSSLQQIARQAESAFQSRQFGQAAQLFEEAVRSYTAPETC
jgi:hypothetical protein